MLFRLKIVVALFLLAPAFAGTNQTILVTAPRLDDLDLMAVDTAADVTVIDRAAIEKSGAVSVPELLRNEANVLLRSFSGNPNDGQIAMRGFGDNSHLRTLILVDGHKLNRPDMGVTGWQSIPVSNIEKIEVIRGGQNVLYGDHALAGVVKITTKRGADAGTRLGGVMGSFGYLSGFVGHGGAVGDIDYYAGIDSYQMDGFRSNSTSRATTLAGSLSWYASDTDILTLRVSCADSHLLFSGPLTYEQMQDDPTQSDYSGDDFSDMKSGQGTAIWETERSWGAVRVASGLNVRDIDWELGGMVANNRQTGVSLGPRVKWGGEDNFIMGGMDGFYDVLKFTSYVPTDPSYVNAHADLGRLKLSPYFFMQHKTEKKLTLGGGVRYERTRTDHLYEDYVDNQILPYIETNRGTFPNPNYKNPPDIDATNSYDGVVVKDGWAGTLSLAQDFYDNGSAWLRYDRVYRYPSLDEVAAYQGYPLSDPLNEKLDPETGNVFELGARWTTPMWRVSWTAYHMRMDNEIVFDDLAKLNRNLGATRRMGTEAELALDCGWYGANTRWTLQDARMHGGENGGNQVPLAPRYYGVCSAWIDPVEELRLTLSWAYVSKQYQGNDEANISRKMDAYGLLGFGVDITLGEYAKVNLAMDNLLNKTYATTAYTGAYYPGYGRSFRCGLTVEF